MGYYYVLGRVWSLAIEVNSISGHTRDAAGTKNLEVLGHVQNILAHAINRYSLPVQ